MSTAEDRAGKKAIILGKDPESKLIDFVVGNDDEMTKLFMGVRNPSGSR